MGFWEGGGKGGGVGVSECACMHVNVCFCVCEASGVIQTGNDEKKSTNKVKNPQKVHKA